MGFLNSFVSLLKRIFSCKSTVGVDIDGDNVNDIQFTVETMKPAEVKPEAT